MPGSSLVLGNEMHWLFQPLARRPVQWSFVLNSLPRGGLRKFCVSEAYDLEELTPRAVSVSLINMKGGVGKTTIASQLAHAALKDDLKVLAVDLDPQSNLSQSLMGARGYVEHLKESRPTIVQIFDEYIPAGGDYGAPRPIDVDKVIVRMSARRKYWWPDRPNSTLDLIPSRLELSRTLKNPTGKERRLAKALAQISDRYDLILIDCAPTESILTDAAYFASRYVIVPVRTEFMATIGLPLLARSIKEFQIENDDHDIEIAGLVFNRSSYSEGPEERSSITEVREQAQIHGWHIFENRINYSASYPRAGREGTPLWLTSDARQSVIRDFERLKNEVFAKLDIRRRAT